MISKHQLNRLSSSYFADLSEAPGPDPPCPPLPPWRPTAPYCSISMSPFASLSNNKLAAIYSFLSQAKYACADSALLKPSCFNCIAIKVLC